MMNAAGASTTYSSHGTGRSCASPSVGATSSHGSSPNTAAPPHLTPDLPLPRAPGGHGSSPLPNDPSMAMKWPSSSVGAGASPRIVVQPQIASKMQAPGISDHFNRRLRPPLSPVSSLQLTVKECLIQRLVSSTTCAWTSAITEVEPVVDAQDGAVHGSTSPQVVGLPADPAVELAAEDMAVVPISLDAHSLVHRRYVHTLGSRI